MGPEALVIAALLAAGTTAVSIDQSKKQARAQRRARTDARRRGIENQNALVQQGFANRRNALGLGTSGMGQTSPSGNAASQTGSVLTSVTGQGNSILG